MAGLIALGQKPAADSIGRSQILVMIVSLRKRAPSVWVPVILCVIRAGNVGVDTAMSAGVVRRCACSPGGMRS
jgi:hypothetical protein